MLSGIELTSSFPCPKTLNSFMCACSKETRSVLFLLKDGIKVYLSSAFFSLQKNNGLSQQKKIPLKPKIEFKNSLRGLDLDNNKNKTLSQFEIGKGDLFI